MFENGVKSLEHGMHQRSNNICAESNEKLKMDEDNHYKNW